MTEILENVDKAEMPEPRYVPHRDRHRRIDSAIAAIKAILPIDLYPAHKRELLDVCIWKLTEADGKHNTRYWSEGALNAGKPSWRHEHVFERNQLIAELLAGEDVDRVCDRAVACVVTIDEHRALGAAPDDVKGWDRYRSAGIRVFDAQAGEWIEPVDPNDAS